MSRKNRLVPPSEVITMLNELKKFGLNIQAVDVRHDGLTVQTDVALLSQRAGVLASAGLSRNSGGPEDAYHAWKQSQKKKN